MSYSKEYETPVAQERREDLVKEINRSVIQPLSFEIFKKTKEEKLQLANAKRNFEVLKKNQVRYNDSRSEIVRTLSKSPMPNWGSVNVRIF